MTPTRLHTGFPRTDARFPQFAPLFGAQPLFAQPERGLEAVLSDAEPSDPAVIGIRTDPWPEVSVGVLTASLSGALTGGIAAGRWSGAGIGAGLNAAAWSGITLLGTFRELGPRSRLILGLSAATGILVTGVGLWVRSRGEP